MVIWTGTCAACLQTLRLEVVKSEKPAGVINIHAKQEAVLQEVGDPSMIQQSELS